MLMSPRVNRVRNARPICTRIVSPSISMNAELSGRTHKVRSHAHVREYLIGIRVVTACAALRRATVREPDAELARRDERQRLELRTGMPFGPVGRTAELMFEIAADDRRPVQDADAVVVR